MKRIAELADKVRNWGRWGDDDEVGTLNLIDAAAIKRGAAAVRKGKTFSLGLDLGASGPQNGQIPHRFNPIHLMSQVCDHYMGDFHANDDILILPLQSSTQWDSLAHVYYGDKLYNGYSASGNITTAGAAKNAIDKQGATGVTSRGVLMDMARLKGVKRLAPGTLITRADLEAAEEKQGIQVESGDIVLLRTGHITVFTEDGDRDGYMGGEPGIGIDGVEWLSERGAAAIASDTLAVEVMPCEQEDLPFPVHLLCIRDMGLPLGEMFDFEALAADCEEDGAYDCMFSAPPLRVTGGIGSPLNPVAVK
jgi:kynurenine formamidase